MTFQTTSILRIATLAVLTAFLPTFAADKDDDGVPNKYDLCKDEPEDKDGVEDNDGCPDVDDDKDGICDDWVAAKGLSAKYAQVCKGADKCKMVPEDKDGFEDGDGCPDPDNDKDGIPDTKDKCPNAPEDFDGFEDNDGCPDTDNDKDGIPDDKDKCATTQEDKDGFEDEDGCPELDNDKDGIPDDKDKCPDQAETVNQVDDEDGCPDHATAKLEPVTTFPLVRFRSSTAELTFEAQQPLDMFAKQMIEHQKKVELRFFTWYKGKKKEDYLALLKERSRIVVAYLVEKGVKPEQLVEVDYSLENFDAFKGTERDFNQEKPVEAHLVE